MAKYQKGKGGRTSLNVIGKNTGGVRNWGHKGGSIKTQEKLCEEPDIQSTHVREPDTPDGKRRWNEKEFIRGGLGGQWEDLGEKRYQMSVGGLAGSVGARRTAQKSGAQN